MSSSPANVTLPAALAAWDAGLCVVRARTDGSKAPLGKWEQYQTQRPSRAQVEAWFALGHPGIGVICGSVSGDVEMFELEGRFVAAHKDEFISRCNAAGLELLLRRLANGYHWGSPSGGRNFLYRVDGCPVDGNTKLARNENSETLIETRGEGGFVILPPSHGPVHPSGAPWILRGGSFADIPTITAEERQKLFEVAQSFDAGPASPPITVNPTRLHKPTPYTGGRVGDSWVDTVVAHVATQPLQQLLESYGWSYCYTDSHGRTLMRRPGKNEGVSASINTSGRLHVFSTSTPFTAGLKKAPTYDHLDVIAAYEHRGDRMAAARHIAEQTGILDAWKNQRSPAVITAPQEVDPATGEIVRDDRNLPDDFWNARPHLTHIRRAAHARSISADAVLGAVLCRVAALIPPTITLPPIVGGAASLNLYVGIVARSGSGKSTADMIAGELVSLKGRHDIVTNGLGSGEGVIEQYLESVTEEIDGKKRTVKKQTKTSALVTLDEGQALAEMGSRQGSTLMPVLRSMWTGSDVGQANASQERYRHLDAHKYRLALLTGFQPEYAHDIIADATGGTPQRFVFVHGVDPAVETADEEWPGPLEFDPPPSISGGYHLAVDPDIAQQVRTRFRLKQAGKLGEDGLDSHADLWRLKIAGILAILDGRTDIRHDDWELSGMLWKASRAVRSWIIAVHQTKLEQAEKATAAKLANRAAAVEQTAEQRALESGARSLARRVHALGRAAKRDVRAAVASKHRAVASIDDMIQFAVDKGWIEADSDGFKAGESRPL